MTGSETPCFPNNCSKEGWVLHSRDGRFAYVGDAGDVIDTTTRHSVAYLAPLANTRKMIEIDWTNGLPVSSAMRRAATSPKVANGCRRHLSAPLVGGRIRRPLFGSAAR